VVGRAENRRPDDIKVEQVPHQRAFWDTPLDSILRKSRACARSCFTGVNTDQCVLHSLDRCELFSAMACIMVEDCCSTTSSGFLHGGNGPWNVKKCFGPSSPISNAVIASLGERAGA